MRSVTSKFAMAFSAVVMSAAVAGAQTFVGSTMGCFYTGAVACDPMAAGAVTSVGGLTFTGSNFSVNGVDGVASVNTLDGNPGFAGHFGNFALSSAPQDYSAQNFVLRIMVTQPGNAAGSFMADLSGSVNATGGSSVFVDFMNNGFVVLSPASAGISAQVNDLAVNVGGNNLVNGRLAVATVPEPSTYMLLATGIGALGLVARRRRA